MKIKDLNVCSRIAIERKRLKLTQSTIANTCDVTIKTVGRWEKNIAIPSDKLALLIPLGYDITYVLTNVKFEASAESQTENAPASLQNLPNTEINQEQRMWLNIIENLTSSDSSQIKEFGLALLGYSQAKNQN